MRVLGTFFFALIAVAGLVLSGAPAGAQETDATPPPSAPVFSLPPGQDNEPEPDVVGPRAPGIAPPRLITSEDQPPQTTSNARPADAVPAPGSEPGNEPASAAAGRPGRTAGASIAAGTSNENPTPAQNQEGAEVIADADGSDTAPAQATASANSPPPAVTSAPQVSGPDSTAPLQSWLLPAVALILLLLAGMFLWKRRAGGAQAVGPRDFEEPGAPHSGLTPTGPPAGPLSPRPKVVPASPAPASPVPASPVPAPPTPVPAPGVRAPSPTTVSPLTAPLVARSTNRQTTPSAPPPRFTPSAPPAAPLVSGAERPGQIEIEFQPREAELTSEGFVLAFHLLIHNVSGEPVRDIAISMGIRSADTVQAQPRNANGKTRIKADSLAGQTTGKFEGEIRLARSAFKQFQIEGKPVLIPIIDLMPSYVDCNDGLRETSLSLILGREQNPPTERVMPIRLDRPPARLGAVGCRIIESA